MLKVPKCKFFPFSKVILILLFTCSVHPTSGRTLFDQCNEIRAVFDIGGYTTRMVVAKVNICKNQIEEILENVESQIPYADNILPGKKGGNILAEHIMNLGIQTIKVMRGRAEKHSPVGRLGIVSNVISRSSNGPIFMNALETVGKMRLVESESKDMAQIGLYSVAHTLGRNNPNVVVWDIGATNSIMISPHEEDNSKYHYYIDSIAAITFRNWIITNLQKKDPHVSRTPNPIGLKNSEQALMFATKYARETVSEKIKELVKTRPIIGIGGVHLFAFPDKKGLMVDITKKELQNAIYFQKEYNDRSLGGKFASSKVSNLILLLGFMEALELNSIKVLHTNSITGLLIHPAHW